VALNASEWKWKVAPEKLSNTVKSLAGVPSTPDTVEATTMRLTDVSKEALMGAYAPYSEFLTESRETVCAVQERESVVDDTAKTTTRCGSLVVPIRGEHIVHSWLRTL
jgi:hypothetical protein